MEMTTKECDGLTEIRCLIQEFLNGKEGTLEVRKYLSTVIDDDSILLIYLKGRNYRVKLAWETLKKKAEVRFNDYPEVYSESAPELLRQLQKKGFAGVLKVRDKYGRRIICLDAVAWNPDEMSVEQVTTAVTFCLERLQLDKDALTNGIIAAVNCDKIGWKHVTKCTFHVMMRLLNITWAYPLAFKRMYYLNCPTYVGYVHKMMKPFLTEKIKKRVMILTKDKEFKLLHENLSPKILPKFLGGDVDNDEALELEFFL